MKLKKIVSLALAGVLAVSMLAGCATNNNSNSNSSTTQVTSTSAVAAFQNALKSYNPDLKITVKENSSLATAIKSDSTTKDLIYSDLISTGSGVATIKTLLGKLYTDNVVTSSAIKDFTTTTSNLATVMVPQAGSAAPAEKTVAYSVQFLTDKPTNTTNMTLESNEFAKLVAENKTKNNYEKVGTNSDQEFNAEYTLTVYTADVTSVGGESGTLLVLVVESSFTEVKD